MEILLLTGFLPFRGEVRNPSGEIAERLSGIEEGGFRVESVVLPVERRSAYPAASAAIERCSPKAVLALGLGSDRAVIGVERVARNIDDYRQADEAGARPEAEPVVPGAPGVLCTSLPEEEIARVIRDAGVPAVVSDDAGSFLCNHLYYRLLHRASADPGASFQTLFLHLPPLPEAVARRGEARASMALETSEQAVRSAIRAIGARLARR